MKGCSECLSLQKQEETLAKEQVAAKRITSSMECSQKENRTTRKQIQNAEGQSYQSLQAVN